MRLDVHLQEAPTSAMPFVIRTWLDNYRSSKEGRRWYRQGEYFERQRPRINALLESPETKCTLAMMPETTTAVGWACWRGATLHYIYVRRDYRGMGVGAQLLEASGVSRAACRTKGLETCWPKLAETVRDDEQDQD